MLVIVIMALASIVCAYSCTRDMRRFDTTDAVIICAIAGITLLSCVAIKRASDQYETSKTRHTHYVQEKH